MINGKNFIDFMKVHVMHFNTTYKSVLNGITQGLALEYYIDSDARNCYRLQQELLAAIPGEYERLKADYLAMDKETQDKRLDIMTIMIRNNLEAEAKGEEQLTMKEVLGHL